MVGYALTGVFASNFPLDNSMLKVSDDYRAIPGQESGMARGRWEPAGVVGSPSDDKTIPVGGASDRGRLVASRSVRAAS